VTIVVRTRGAISSASLIAALRAAPPGRFPLFCKPLR
jgi:hypothetical protein